MATLWQRKRLRRTTEPDTVRRPRIAIFGGTFDPIHAAHLMVAKEAVVQYGLSSVMFVVAANPPHKTGAIHASFEDRYQMVELACARTSEFAPSRIEEHDEISYSIQTIQKVKTTAGPDALVYFLIGADAFADIQSWHRWGEVVREVSFIVVTRPGHHYQAPPGSSIFRLETLAMPVSSSAIRARLEAGKESPELPPAVMQYIRTHGLYGFRPR
ncbi:MAG: nicotinate (nicotinamide) nucleotide adenylyltransferase [Acidobacteriales bacterium]|nr:MAG: nicotinate (nicotinamide) nucleotide adenylyltransferase [Terriglobales bacterium]